LVSVKERLYHIPLDINFPQSIFFHASYPTGMRIGLKNSFNFYIGDWKTELLEYIDESNLPEYYGGKCRDPDGNPKCKTKVDY